MQLNTNPNRLAFLDGLRGIAIFLVVSFHYFAQGDAIYGDAFKNIPLIGVGFFGVQLFFMISGYVIFMTLRKCDSFIQFISRRWVRLTPVLLLSSAIIFFTSMAIPTFPDELKVLDFVPSLTYINPYFINLLTNLDIRSIDGVFWSLYIEFQFYVLIAILFKIIKDNFLVVLALIGTIVQFLKYFPIGILNSDTITSMWWVLLFEHLPWFCVGISAFLINQNERSHVAFTVLALSSITIAFTDFSTLAYRLTILGIFIIPALWIPFRRVLNLQTLQFLGFISYPFYLLHQSIGKSIIQLINTPDAGIWVALTPFAILSASAYISFCVAKYFEPAAQYRIKKLLGLKRGGAPKTA